MADKLDVLYLKNRFEFLVREKISPVGSARPMIDFIHRLGGKKLVGAEIGVMSGDNAYSILRLIDIKRLYLIDPYCEYVNELGDIVDFSKYEKIARKRLKKYGDRIVWVKDFSSHCHETIPDNLDFVYIDGNHDYDFVKKDIELYYPKLCKGGIFGGHDFNASYLGVVKAVNEFIEKEKLIFNGHGNDWWIKK